MVAAAAALALLHGVVMRGPTPVSCPSCYKPAANVALVFVRFDGTVGGRARTDAQGRFSVRLKRGFYDVRIPGAKKFMPRSTMLAGPTTNIEFLIDTRTP